MITLNYFKSLIVDTTTRCIDFFSPEPVVNKTYNKLLDILTPYDRMFIGCREFPYLSAFEKQEQLDRLIQFIKRSPLYSYDIFFDVEIYKILFGNYPIFEAITSNDLSNYFISIDSQKLKHQLKVILNLLIKLVGRIFIKRNREIVIRTNIGLIFKLMDDCSGVEILVPQMARISHNSKQYYYERTRQN